MTTKPEATKTGQSGSNKPAAETSGGEQGTTRSNKPAAETSGGEQGTTRSNKPASRPRRRKGRSDAKSANKPNSPDSRGKKDSRRSDHPQRKQRGRARTAKKLDPRVEAILARIGTPPETPFLPDPFQEEALHLLRDTDVLVSAATGAGKTWIALEAIRECLMSGGRAWYACPLKALSNAKFEEFVSVFGPESVGIVTGDRKNNPGAPVIVGTTEILRNQLYDAMSEKVDLPCELVILDEAHYLGERDRGVVWEETLIYLPRTTRLLLLSASIRNSQEIADWLGMIREVECSVVISSERPVPLHPLFLFPDGSVGLLSGQRGLAREVGRYLKSVSQKTGGRRAPRWGMGRILARMRQYNLLPAIFFLKSRADCDRAILQGRPVFRGAEADAAFHRDLEECLEQYPYLRHHRALPDLVSRRLASHHAGHLPYWKLLVEKMMLKGHLDAIFATSTVAGGVNFPARSVVLMQSDRFNGKEFQDLSATDLQQMIGRAGRRGKDEVGFALVVPGPYLDPMLIHRRFLAEPDPIESQIRINFSMVLNLLQSHSPGEVRVMIDRSLAAFQQESRVGKQGGKGGFDVREAVWEDFLRHKDLLQETKFVSEHDQLTWEGQWAAQLRLDHPLLVAEAIREGAFEGASPEVLAGMIATFVIEGDRYEDLEGQMRVSSVDVSRRVTRMKKKLRGLMRHLERKGFDTPEIPLWPAAAVFLWAKGSSWEALLKVVPLEEGALAMMIIRTADHLNQILGLRNSHPELAETAGQAMPLIFREPVWI